MINSIHSMDAVGGGCFFGYNVIAFILFVSKTTSYPIEAC